jgi:ABC-type Mn2+/Zn2+ transport system ATPase subunit
MESRIAILGSNGAGKSTLIKIMMNKLQLNSG